MTREDLAPQPLVDALLAARAGTRRAARAAAWLLIGVGLAMSHRRRAVNE